MQGAHTLYYRILLDTCIPFSFFVFARYNVKMESEITNEKKEDQRDELPHESGETKNIELLLFELDVELYAVSVDDVESVMKIPPVTAVPNAPSSIVGVFHLRGRVIVVLDLLKRMGLVRTSSFFPYYLFVAHQEKNYFGVLVDRTRTVVRVPAREITPVNPVTAAHIPERYMKGMFLYQDKVTKRSHSPNIMIEPIQSGETARPEPLFVTRPVIILDLQALLDEESLKGVGGIDSDVSTPSSQ